jgi:hypothetical protein
MQLYFIVQVIQMTQSPTLQHFSLVIRLLESIYGFHCHLMLPTLCTTLSSRHKHLDKWVIFLLLMEINSNHVLSRCKSVFSKGGPYKMSINIYLIIDMEMSTLKIRKLETKLTYPVFNLVFSANRIMSSSLNF